MDLSPSVEYLIGQRLKLDGHFNEAITIEGIRPLGAGYEVRVRCGNGVLDETILSADEVQTLRFFRTLREMMIRLPRTSTGVSQT